MVQLQSAQPFQGAIDLHKVFFILKEICIPEDLLHPTNLEVPETAALADDALEGLLADGAPDNLKGAEIGKGEAEALEVVDTESRDLLLVLSNFQSIASIVGFIAVESHWNIILLEHLLGVHEPMPFIADNAAVDQASIIQL